jgi:hypothetical protein
MKRDYRTGGVLKSKDERRNELIRYKKMQNRIQSQ